MGADVALIEGQVPQSVDTGAPGFQSLQPLPLTALEQLSGLHAEQAHSIRRMKFLDQAVHAALALMLLGITAIALGAGTPLSWCFAWSLLMLLAIIGLLRCHLRGADRTADQPDLARAAGTLRAVLLYAGFAWGSGALLVLPATTQTLPALLFAVAPSAVLAALLNDHKGVLRFLVPVTAITILAAILGPWPDAGLDTALFLMLQSGIAALVIRRRPEKIPAGLLLGS